MEKVRGTFCHYDGKALLGGSWVELVTRVPYGEGGNGGMRAMTVLPYCNEGCAQADLVVEFPYPIEKVAAETVAMLHRELRKEREEDRSSVSWDFIECVHERLERLVEVATKTRSEYSYKEEQRRLVMKMIGSGYRVGPASVDPESMVGIYCATCGKTAGKDDQPHKPACLIGKLEAMFGAPDPAELQAALDGYLKEVGKKKNLEEVERDKKGLCMEEADCILLDRHEGSHLTGKRCGTDSFCGLSDGHEGKHEPPVRGSGEAGGMGQCSVFKNCMLQDFHEGPHRTWPLDETEADLCTVFGTCGLPDGHQGRHKVRGTENMPEEEIPL